MNKDDDEDDEEGQKAEQDELIFEVIVEPKLRTYWTSHRRGLSSRCFV